MLEEIPTRLAENYGLVGMSWAVLLGAIAVLWMRLGQRTDQCLELAKQYAEDVRQTTAALVELTMFIRGKK